MKAPPKDHISVPPSDVVAWVAYKKPGGMAIRINARTWFQARAAALLAFQCEAKQIRVERLDFNDTNESENP